MTVREALRQAHMTLAGISVPVALRQQITEPIERAMGLIMGCLDSMAAKKPADGGDDEKPALTEEDI